MDAPSPRTSNPGSSMGADAHERGSHLKLLNLTSGPAQADEDAGFEEIRTTPLFTSTVQSAINKGELGQEGQHGAAKTFPQYGMLGLREGTFCRGGYTPANPPHEDNLVYANMNAPWSAFICGSQGGGKSHTLSCLLENSLLSPSPAGKLPNPLAALVFHYDRYTSINTTQLCEASYLCSSGVPVRVLVSPSNYHNMARLYSNLPGLESHARRPIVMPLYLQERQLNITNMKTLMAVSDGSDFTPLYLEVLFQILRDMARESKGRPGVDYREFKSRLCRAAFSRQQNGPLKLRLQLLESFLDSSTNMESGINVTSLSDTWNFEPGSLTIVDLSDPFINANDACALFSICLTLFMEKRGRAGRIVALDEAHKFLTQSGEAQSFTEELVSIIRQQRHLATRVVIATQEPTLSPKLIELCNVTIVHRFLSPAWYEILKQYLAGARSDSHVSGAVADIFRTIVSLRTGEALLFCPTALLDVGSHHSTNPFAKPHLEKLNDSFIKLRIRNRVTADGGKSIMASDVTQASTSEASLNHEFEHTGLDLVDPFDSGMDFIPFSASRLSRAQPSDSRSQPESQKQAQQPASQSQQEGKQQLIQPQSQRSPLQQLANNGKQAIVQAPLSIQPQQVPVQSLTKKQKKALQPKLPVQNQIQQGAQQLTKKQKKALQTGALQLTEKQKEALQQGTLQLTERQKKSVKQGAQQLTKKQKKAFQQDSQQVTTKQEEALQQESLASSQNVPPAARRSERLSTEDELGHNSASWASTSGNWLLID